MGERKWKMFVPRPDFEKRGGILPVVAQNAATLEVLTVAYANEEAWRKTLESGNATYYSTSKGRLHVKGEESGNFQKVVDMLVDCDSDAIIYLVYPQGDGDACHLGARSCFFQSVFGALLMPVKNNGGWERRNGVEITVHKNFERMAGFGS